MTTSHTKDSPRTFAARPVISVYGSSVIGVADADYAAARRLGVLLAQGGADVACGGYGGVMEAVARGATEAGGRAFGYTVRGWTSRSANAYLSKDQPCPDLYTRLRYLIERSSALIALGGGIGTLAEVMLAWNNLYMRLIDERPLLVVGPQWKSAIDGLSGNLEISTAHLELITICPSVDDVVDTLRRVGITR
jgi:uncharacterized protein (TIGR00730 family)